MRNFSVTLLLITLVFFGVSLTSATDLETEYLMAVADYYEVSYEMAYDIYAIGVEIEDVAVTLSVAGKAGADPRNVAATRVKGKSWQSICKKNELGAADFYVMINRQFVSKTFSPIFDKFKNTDPKNWNEINLSDSDYCNLINLKFVYSHYDYSVFHVMAMRDYQKTYPKISNKIFAVREAETKKALASANNNK